jgi:transcription termination factor NusB
MLYRKDFIRKGHGWNSISLLLKKTKNRIKKLTQVFSWETKQNKTKQKTIEQIMKVKTSEEYWTLVHLNLEF